MTAVIELSIQGAAVLVTVEERDGLFYAKVNGMPQVQAVGVTRESALSKVANRMQHAIDTAA